MKVLSYNIREGGDGRLPFIAAVVRAQQADAVALLEANSRANTEALAHELGMELVFGRANTPFHIAWLARLPILRWENHRLPILTKTLLEIETENPHLRLFATHLGSRHDKHTPAEEVPAILDVLHPLVEAGQPHLLVGDFNALAPGDPIGPLPKGVEKRGEAMDGAPRPAITRILEASYIDCYRALHPQTSGYSYSSNAPWLRIDYIFASPALAGRLQRCDVVAGGATQQASDHLPLWAEFS
jgi:endonuclease/exonuclease/phosphatase family metal-dependent hydrolase